MFPRFWLCTRFHAVPFQCSARVRVELGVASYEPTAQASVEEVAATPRRAWSTVGPPGSGLRTRFQVVPFVSSIRVWKTPLEENPTAHGRASGIAATSSSSFTEPGFAGGTRVHAPHGPAEAGTGAIAESP